MVLVCAASTCSYSLLAIHCDKKQVSFLLSFFRFRMIPPAIILVGRARTRTRRTPVEHGEGVMHEMAAGFGGPFDGMMGQYIRVS